MGIGTSIFLIATGAILKWAVNADVSGLEISTIGTILLVVGILGLIISLLLTRDVFGRRGGSDTTVVRDRVVERDPYVEPRV